MHGLEDYSTEDLIFDRGRVVSYKVKVSFKYEDEARPTPFPQKRRFGRHGATAWG